MGFTGQQEEKLKHVFPWLLLWVCPIWPFRQPSRSHHGPTMNVCWTSHPTIPTLLQHLPWRGACFGEEPIAVSLPQSGCWRQTKHRSLKVLLWRQEDWAWHYVCQHKWRWCDTIALHQRLNLHLPLSDYLTMWICNVQDELDFPRDIWLLLCYTVSLHVFRGHIRKAKWCPLRSHLCSSVRKPAQYFWGEKSRFQGTTEKHTLTLPAGV